MKLDYLKKPHAPQGEPIIFTDEELADVDSEECDPMVITAGVGRYNVKRILVDQGSSADILFWDAFSSMGLSREQLSPFNEHLIGFSGAQVPVEGMIELNLTLGEDPRCVCIPTIFVVVKTPSAYNAILGRPSLNAARAVVSTAHLLMKFPTPHGVGQVRANQEVARQCYATSLAKPQTSREAPQNPPPSSSEKGKEKEHAVMNCEIVDLRDEIPQNHPQPSDEMEAVTFPGAPEKTVNICATLPPPEKEALVQFLHRNEDIFAWSASDMPGIDPNIICHSLNVDGRPGVFQKKRNLGQQRQQAAKEEVEKLLAAGFIRETKYPTWLSNVVLV